MSVVVPTYNERQNVPILLERLLRHTPFRVIVVDDMSPDGTAELAREWAARHPDRIRVLTHEAPRSFSGSYVLGMRDALALGSDFVCQMDADLSHDPDSLNALVAAAASADVVIGSRYVTGGGVSGWPWRRRALSAAANAYVRWTTGVKVRDATSGFKCWRAAALDRVLARPLLSDGYALQFEMLYRLKAAGGRLREVPIVFVDRCRGASKMSVRTIVESVCAPLRIVRDERRASRTASRDSTTQDADTRLDSFTINHRG